MDVELEAPLIEVEVGNNDIEIELPGGARGIKGDKGEKGDTGSTGPRGEKGDTGDTGPRGEKGDAGFSPVVSTTRQNKETTITIRDAEGVHTATIYDGQDGVPLWGNIEGDLSDQTDLQNALNSKANSNDLSEVATSGSYNDLTEKPTIPTRLSDLTSDSTHRTVTDAEKTSWNNKSDFSGSYNDLTNKPSIPSKTSQLTNDSGFINSSYHDSTKQDTLVSGTNIKTINNNSLLGSGNLNIESGTDFDYGLYSDGSQSFSVQKKKGIYFTRGFTSFRLGYPYSTVNENFPETASPTLIFQMINKNDITNLSDGDIVATAQGIRARKDSDGSVSYSSIIYFIRYDSTAESKIKITQNNGSLTDVETASYDYLTQKYYKKTETYTSAQVDDLLDSKADTTSIPIKTSDLTNDSGFITNTVNNLNNYYSKSDTYTKTEINNLIGSVSSLDIEVVQTLPTTDISISTIYLVPKTAATNDNYDEYIYVSNKWEHIGSTQVDLSNYYTKTQVDGLLDTKADDTDIPTKVSDLQNDAGYITGYTETDPTVPSHVKSITQSNITSWNNKADTSDIPTKTSDLTNDSGFITSSSLPTKTSDLTNDSGFITNSTNDLSNYYTKNQTDDLLDDKADLADIPEVGNSKVWYATCDTPAATQVKTVNIEGFKREIGTVIIIKFTYENSYNGTLKLVVNNSGEVPIRLREGLNGGQYIWNAGETLEMVYVGSSYLIIGKAKADTVYYGVTKLNAATNSDSTEEAATPSAVKSAYDLANSKQDAITSTNKLSYSLISGTPTIPTKTSDLTNDSGFIDNSYHDSTKQDTLVSGTNIKTINNESIVGSGNISISGGATSYNDLTDKPIYDASYVELATGSTITNEQYQELKDATINQNILNLNGKVATGYYAFGDIIIIYTNGNQMARFMVSKTDNNHTVSLNEFDLAYDEDVQDLYEIKQDALVSGTNIKTVNNQSLLGSGNISISGGATSYNDLTDKPIYDASYIADAADEETTITNAQYQELNNASLNEKIIIVYGLPVIHGTEDSGGLQYRTLTYLINGKWATKFIISPQNNNHTVTYEEIELVDSDSIPTATSDLTNDSDFTTKAYVDGLVGDVETILTTLDVGNGV